MPTQPRRHRPSYAGRHSSTIRETEKRRGSAASRGYGHRWRKERAAYLAAHPLCRECERRGEVRQADIVDHVVPHKGDMAAFWDVSNWQPLCKPCHDRKTLGRDARG
ncbi:MAG: HNH endonuclease signature motif containing protein [Rickettsiales bacterium]